MKKLTQKQAWLELCKLVKDEEKKLDCLRKPFLCNFIRVMKAEGRIDESTGDSMLAKIEAQRQKMLREGTTHWIGNGPVWFSRDLKGRLNFCQRMARILRKSRK